MNNQVQKPSGESTRGAQTSLFDPDSSACAAALNDLSVVMEQVGFIVDKKRVSESTLRAYIRKRLTYPLLNPRFQRRRFEVCLVEAFSRSVCCRRETKPSSAGWRRFPHQRRYCSSRLARKITATSLMATSRYRYAFEVPVRAVILMSPRSDRR
jgi:hypothetical protein